MNALRYFALLLAAGTLPALGQIHYAPTTQHYRLHSTVRRITEQNGEKSDGTITNDQVVTMAIQASHGKSALTDKDTLHFAVSLDSTNMSSTLAVQLPDVSVMQGTTVTGDMRPTGEVLNFRSDTKATDGVDRESIVASMAHFLVPLPASATNGTNWTDTASTNVSKDSYSIQTTTITTSSVVGDTTYGGQKAWRVRRQSVFKMTGTQKQTNQVVSSVGDGTGDGMYYISSHGVYLGSTASQKMNMTVKSAGTVIPVVQTVTSTVEIAH
ncbi:MAG TPA: hypothetical protein VIB98_07610 [Gemmatimonadaceae bacterium]|jgi:hypothetical protein